MKTYKSIAFAYATSPIAKDLGFNDTGCFYIQQRVLNEAQQWNTGAVHNAEGYAKATDRDLITSYLETDGEPCPMFLRHGNQDALNIIKGSYSDFYNQHA